MTDAMLKKIRRVGKMLNALERISHALAGKVAFQFFCTPRRLPARERDAALMAAARQETLHFRNLKLCCYTWTPTHAATGRSALLLHGWESNSARWRKYIKGLLEAGFTVHALDAPASGNSQGKRLNALLFSAAVKTYIDKNGAPYVMIGHSLGGAAAVMSTTLLQAARPSKMVLMGVFAESMRVIRDFGQLLGANERVIQAIFSEVEKRSGMPIEAYSVAQKIALLQDVEGLVVHDLQDEVAPVEEGSLIAAAWGAQFLQTSGMGHSLQDKSVVKAVLEFCRKP